MVVEKKLRTLFRNLEHVDTAVFDMSGFTVAVRTIDNRSKLSVSTPVYFGGNYIPKSVRNCIKGQTSIKSKGIYTFLTVDESEYRVYLNYLGLATEIDPAKFQQLLIEFDRIAQEWRAVLDEHDKRDLIFIKVK